MTLLQRVFGSRRPANPRGELLSRLPRGKVGAEIGVWKGDFSARVLAIAKPSMLHLVDPWLFAPQYPKRWYGGLIARNQHEMDATFDAVVKRFKGDHRVSIHRDRSADFFATFTQHLDWVYIDGDHSLEAVLNDLRSAWRCLRPGGILCGDDLDWPDGDGSRPVLAALATFAEETATSYSAIGNQFFIQKGLIRTQ
jgi:hypothetical protein